MFFGDAIKYVGDLRGGNVAIKQNYAIVCNIYYPSPDKAKSSMERSRAIALNQAKGPLVSLVPILAEKKKGFDTLYDSLNDGNRIIKMTYTMLLFGKSEDEVTEAGVQARSYWREQRFTLLEDRFVQLPLLINCLPMMADRDAVSDLWRYKTITAEHAAVILPVFGEWKGTGTPHMNLVSRNGQLMTFSMHDTSSNKNMLICATSGGGKSFFTNDIIMSYMSEGAQVWVIDVGRSYLKLAEALNGDFIHFGSDSDISINPFPMIVSMDGQKGTRSRMLSEEEIWSIESGEESDDGEEDAIVGLVCAMATINSPLDDVQLTALRAIISKIWLEKDREMLVDHVADECAKSEDRRVRDLATRLQAFTSKGSYGRYFSRPNNVTFNNQLTVLELEELKSRAHLQKVVLFQLIYQIQQAVYLGDRSKRKLVIIDEAWDLLANGGPEVQRFIEHAYRRFRKYGASVLLVTQSIQDMYKSPVGEAIVENSATKGLFSHKDEAVDKLKREAKLTLSEGGYSLLKTVHTNAPWYSEIFLETERGGGVGRLFVNDFQKLLYSTNPEEVAEIESYTKRGYSTVDAINAILKSRSRARS
jgi:conjugal transfer ATP-binding protein TraC